MMDTNNASSNNNNSRQVILEGGLPWGFRIQGGSDTGVQLRIARVNPGSKAALQGIREGDVITSMNGQPTEREVTNSQAHALLKEAGPTLRLGLKQGSTLTKRLFKSSSGASVSSAGDVSSDNAPTKNQQTIAGNGGVAAQSTSASHNSSNNGAVQSSTSTTNKPTSLTRSGSSSSLLSTPYQASSPKPGVWSPGQQQSPPERDNNHQQRQEQQQQPSSISSGTQPPIWIPSSQQPSPKSERKEFRPVRLEALKKQAAAQQQPQQREGGQKPLGGTKPAAPTSLPPFTTNTSTPASQPSASTSNAPTTYSSYLYPSSWDSQRQQNATPYGNNSANSTPINTPASEHSVLTSTSTNFSALSWDRRTNGGSTYSGGSGSTTPTPSLQPLLLPATSSTPTSHLPKVPNPTVTLLQKAREGQLPKGAAYLETPKLGERSGNRLGQPPPPQQLHRSPYEPVYSIQREYCVPSSAASAAVAPSSGDENSQQPSASQQETRKFVDLTANKFSGVGPVSNEGVPIALRSGIREEEDHHHWYRRMYESLHRTGGPGDYVTVRYKAGRGRGGGYQSEPDQNNRYDYDSDAGRYATLDRRRQRIHNDSESNGGSPSRITNHESESYRYQPGRIEDYEPGIRSSITQQQPTKQSPKISIPSKSFTNFALKESGYESDSQLIFRRRYPNDSAEAGGGQTTPATDPQEQRLWYRDIQRGGEVPLHGLRKQQPDRPQGAAHRFAESEVTIHYRSPIRNLQQSGQQQTDIDEEELRQMQAEHMRRVYEQERRRKYIQELEDIESRRHMDNFTPLMKSPIPLNRYDDFMDDQPVPLGRPGSQNHQQRDRTPEPKIVARGLYNFVAQNARELSFQKGDIIFIRRQIDKNWYEGEHNAMVGIFPVNYVEIIPYDGVRLTNRKASEGKGRVKFNFVAQTPVELSLVKGELVIITRQVDEHWLEGRIGQRRGIFPISYVDIIQSCSTSTSNPNVKTPTTGGNALITNGSLRSTHQYRNQQPQHFSIQPKMSPANATSQHQYRAAPAQYNKPSSLMVDTRSDPVLYRALYTYAPQNDDELELQENDMICVLEKCDDGWYVGTSQRTGLFGTFPGNYVERV